MGNCKERFQRQTPLWSRSLLQEERRQTGNFPWSQRLTENGSATLWSQLRLCRLPTGTPPERKGREESLGQGEAWEPTPPKSRGKTVMEMQPHTTGNPADNRQFSPLSRALSPVPLPNHRPEPHTPNFYQDWHRMLATAAGQDQLSPQAPRAGAEEWRQRVGGLDSPISLCPL